MKNDRSKGYKVKLSTTERFISKIDINSIDYGCWEWISTKNTRGYGMIRMKHNNKWIYETAHRVSYRHFIGGLDINLSIDHLCMNKSCVNPFHLEQVTRGENSRRGIHAKYGTRLFCTRGHRWTNDNTAYYNGGKQKVCRKCNVINVDKWRRNKLKVLDIA